MSTNAFLRIYMPGGVMSHDQLIEIVKFCRKFKVRTLQFGLRQDVNINLDHYFKEDAKLYLNNLGFDYEFNSRSGRNIVTSYVSNKIFASENWLTEGTYLYILDLFDYQPNLRINIVDPNQGLVPLLTGNLNFIASKTNNYWYLNMDLPKWFPESTWWPGLVYTDDISKVAKNIEALYETKKNITLTELFDTINSILYGNNRPVEQTLKIVPHRLPYYEGINKVGDKYWLGVYKRTYSFSLEFLEAVAEQCFQNHLNKICITPWRSFLIKDIKEENWQEWINLLGLYGVNIRHSSVEMNWRVPDFDTASLDLKMYLVNEFDKMDIRTYGLTFAIRDPKVDLDGIVVIERVPSKNLFKTIQNAGNYHVHHTVDFEPNTREYITYAKDVSYSSLPSVLEKIIKKFYEHKSQPFKIKAQQKQEVKKEKQLLYQCKSCFTVYDQQYGDSVGMVSPGTPFAKLPDTYQCPVCDAPKSDFEQVKDSVVAA